MMVMMMIDERVPLCRTMRSLQGWLPRSRWRVAVAAAGNKRTFPRFSNPELTIKKPPSQQAMALSSGFRT